MKCRRECLSSPAGKSYSSIKAALFHLIKYSYYRDYSWLTARISYCKTVSCDEQEGTPVIPGKRQSISQSDTFLDHYIRLLPLSLRSFIYLLDFLVSTFPISCCLPALCGSTSDGPVCWVINLNQASNRPRLMVLYSILSLLSALLLLTDPASILFLEYLYNLIKIMSSYVLVYTHMIYSFER